MRKRKATNRMLSAVLAAGLAVSGFPTAAYAQETNDTYVLMNIPYAAFYQEEADNAAEVDAFTSATKMKTKTGSGGLAGGSYHTEDGSRIEGVTFPVKLPANVDLSAYTQVTDADTLTLTVTNRGQTTTTTYTGKDVLFERPSYAYYRLEEAPSYYKELTVKNSGGSQVFSFGKAQGEKTAVTAVKAELTTQTGYGDYELDLDGAALTAMELDLSKEDKVYGAVVHTQENHDYGLRHLENIWQGTKLGWCTGFTQEVHGGPTSSAHYEKMMGETITGISYYTSKGMFDISLAQKAYVPIKFANTLEVAEAPVEAGSTSFTETGFPQDYKKKYTVNGLESAADGTITFHSPKPGSYTLTVSDEGQKYADVTTDFVLYTEAIPAAYNGDNEKPALTAASASQEELANFIANITSVSVNGTSYPAAGRGSAAIIKADGGIDTAAVSGDAPIFAQDGTYEMEVTSTGYKNPLKFTWNKQAAGTDNTDAEKPAAQAPAKGSVLKSGNASYRVTREKAEVAYVSTKSVSKTVKIPASVKIGTITYKVTSVAANAFKGNKTVTKVEIGKNVASIGAGAFYGCTKLKNVTILSTKITSVGKNAWKGIQSTATIKVAKSRLAAYQKLFKGKGQGKKVKITA